ncbi:MAG: DUF4919 domain-containing protein [Bacteroidales bacterium]|jgi:hypothetical protein|nr:DUF4919 domain-containing protein [Bacteroidales bacterium]
MKKIITILLLLLSLNAYTQKVTPPDFDRIKTEIEKENSPYFYPTLLQKYYSAANDAMTDLEKHHLYFGFVFQSWYNPNYSSSNERELKTVLKRKHKTSQDYRDIVYWADIMIKENPFSTYALQWKTVALFKLGKSNTEEYDRTTAQYNIIMDAIIGSGSGKSENSPFFVITVEHEYELINYFDCKFVNEDEINNNGVILDRIFLAENLEKIESLYFNVTLVQKYLTEIDNAKKNKKHKK